MIQSNNKGFFKAVKLEVQIRLATSVKLNIEKNLDGLNKVVDAEIDLMFSRLAKKNGGKFIGSPQQLSDWGVKWQPLSQKYARSKSSYNFSDVKGKIKREEKNTLPTSFYRNTGDLLSDMHKKNTVPMSRLLGGLSEKKNYSLGNTKKFSYASNRKTVIKNIASGEIQKTSINQKVEVKIMEKLFKASYPEFFLIFGNPENMNKLGYFSGGYARWHRPFIKQYARWYAQSIITPKIKDYLLKGRKK